MERPRGTTALHQRIQAALERSARVQEMSQELAERHGEIERSVRETVELVHRQRRARADAPRRAARRY
jgi:hypothetical protein